jgi:hypothetical protein
MLGALRQKAKQSRSGRLFSGLVLGGEFLSYSSTDTRTFTISNARYVTSKIAADLDVMRAYYGWPSENETTKYAEEAAILLSGRYLQSVEYGLKRNGKVIFALKYVARSDGTLQTDDRPGRIPIGLNISDTKSYSFLIYTDLFNKLSLDEQGKIKAPIPVIRSNGPNPETGNGYWEQSRTYSSNGEGVLRNIFKPL